MRKKRYRFEIPCTVYEGSMLVGDETLIVEVHAEDYDKAKHAVERGLDEAVRLAQPGRPDFGDSGTGPSLGMKGD